MSEFKVIMQKVQPGDPTTYPPHQEQIHFVCEVSRLGGSTVVDGEAEVELFWELCTSDGCSVGSSIGYDPEHPEVPECAGRGEESEDSEPISWRLIGILLSYECGQAVPGQLVFSEKYSPKVSWCLSDDWLKAKCALLDIAFVESEWSKR